MPRGTNSTDLSIARLESMLRERKSELNMLRRQREKVQQQLNEIDRRIASLGGSKMRGGGRARNAESLVATLEAVLRGSGKPMKVGEIVDAVQKRGYQSSSANFRGIVNQTLIKEKQFSSAGRGLYQMKK